MLLSIVVSLNAPSAPPAPPPKRTPQKPVAPPPKRETTPPSTPLPLEPGRGRPNHNPGYCPITK